MVGRVSYLGMVKQDNYHTHVLYTIPNPNYTLPKPYPFIITYPIHHPTLGTQTGRVLPCASINTTLPWIPTYPYPSIVIPYPSNYPTLPTVGKIPLPTLRIYPTYPIYVTSAYIPVPTSHYLLLGAVFFVPFPFRPVDVSSRDVSSRDGSSHWMFRPGRFVPHIYVYIGDFKV